jgi:hypothetical protein
MIKGLILQEVVIEVVIMLIGVVMKVIAVVMKAIIKEMVFVEGDFYHVDYGIYDTQFLRDIPYRCYKYVMMPGV